MAFLLAFCGSTLSGSPLVLYVLAYVLWAALLCGYATVTLGRMAYPPPENTVINCMCQWMRLLWMHLGGSPVFFRCLVFLVCVHSLATTSHAWSHVSARFWYEHIHPRIQVLKTARAGVMHIRTLWSTRHDSFHLCNRGTAHWLFSSFQPLADRWKPTPTAAVAVYHFVVWRLVPITRRLIVIAQNAHDITRPLSLSLSISRPFFFLFKHLLFNGDK